MTVEHGVDDVVERDPARLEVGLLVEPGERGCGGEPAGEEDPDRLVAAAGRGEELGEQAPVGGLEVGLLRQLAHRGGDGCLALLVEQSGGQLPVARGDRVAVLLDQQYAVILVEGEDRHGPRVIDVFPRDTRAAVLEVVAADVPHGALEHYVARQDRLRGGVVGEGLRRQFRTPQPRTGGWTAGGRARPR